MKNNQNTMKKGLMFLLLGLLNLPLCLRIEAQTLPLPPAKYRVSYSFNVYKKAKDGGSICKNSDSERYHFFFKLFHNDNQIIKYEEFIGCMDKIDLSEGANDVEIEQAKKINRFEWYSFAHRRGFDLSCDATDLCNGNRDIGGKTEILPNDDYIYKEFVNFHSTVDPVYTSTYCRINVKPCIDVATNSLALLDTMTSTILATQGFQSSSYRWQYSDAAEGPWTNLSVYSSTLTISGTQLYGNNFFDKLGKRTYFRIRDAASHGGYENVSLPNMIAAPVIKSTVIQDVRCYGEQNGKITVNFNRKLYPNESMKLFLIGKHGETVYSVLPNNFQDNSYTIDNLPADTFILQLSGLIHNAEQNLTFNTYTDTISPWRKEVIINSPAKLQYYEIVNTPVNCYGGSDGKVTLRVVGGNSTKRAYYKLATDSTYTLFGGTSIFTDTSGLPYGQYQFYVSDTLFGSGTSIFTDISGLPYGQYQFYVSDTLFGSETPIFIGSTYIKSGLPYGQYQFYVSDGKGCLTRDTLITISQPTAQVSIMNTLFTEPSAFGYSNGKIKIGIAGGTTPYHVECYDSTGTGYSIVPNGNEFTAINLKAGKHTFIIKDTNYSCGNDTVSPNCIGCYFTIDLLLNQPPPLLVTVEQQDSIKCHSGHEASLRAIAEGGVPSNPSENNGYRYYYQWFKQDSDTVFEPLPNQTDSMIFGLYSGYYQVQIKDANGITKMSDTFYVTQPDSLELAFAETQATCGFANGALTVLMSGGSTPYYVEWMGTGDSVVTITDMAAGVYGVYVTDRNDCATYDYNYITTPTDMTITDTVIPILCHDDCSGIIQLTIEQGVPPYTVMWQHGATDTPLHLTGLCYGQYTAFITDSIGCVAIKEYALSNPEPVIIGLPDSVTLCVGQSYTIDAGDFSGYEWRAGTPTGMPFATDRQVTLTAQSRYYLTVFIDNGCQGYDSIQVERSDKVIISQFLAATQIEKGEVIKVINNSYPRAEQYEWLFPLDSVQVVMMDSLTAEIFFMDTGNYTIRLRAVEGKCELVSGKQITVLSPSYFSDPGDTETPFIKEFTVYPNPNSGSFTVSVELVEEAPVRLRLIHVSSGVVVGDWPQSGASVYKIPINLMLPVGVYLLRLDSAKENQSLKIIIQ